jgi:cysteine desulfurase / selenocysteine lyase
MNTATTIVPKVFQVEKYRADFPILSKEINGKPLVYLDNAATAQKPIQVIDAIANYYQHQNANIHRGVHTLSQEITAAYEEARERMQHFLNATHAHEIIFTAGTTASINLVADSFSAFVNTDDEIVITAMEHHSNILPWQKLCEQKNAHLKVIPINEAGELMLDDLEQIITSKTKALAFTHISNTLGTINPVKELIERVRQLEKKHATEILILVDGAQAVPHLKPDVQTLDCDFYAFSGHKLFGPTGIGVLYGKEIWLKKLPPYQVGGGTIKTVSFAKTEYADLPLKFEAGTPHIEGTIGLAAAINYLNNIGFEAIAAYEHQLLLKATEQLKTIEGLKIIGQAKNKASVLSFIVEGIHPYDIGTLLDALGVAVRTGHHCTQPLMQFYNVSGTVRASFAFYNTEQEVDTFVNALKRAVDRIKK